EALPVTCAEDAIEEESLIAIRVDIHELGGEVRVRSIRLHIEVHRYPSRYLQWILERLGDEAQIILPFPYFPLIHWTFSAKEQVASSPRRHRVLRIIAVGGGAFLFRGEIARQTAALDQEIRCQLGRRRPGVGSPPFVSRSLWILGIPQDIVADGR